MNNMNNCSDQTREKLKAAYMSRDLGVDFTREKFERIIAAAEQERIRTLRRRKMIKVALVSLILCAACSGLLMGLITWEDASADNDDETKIIKQGDNMVIKSGAADNDETIMLLTDEYENIEDLPTDIQDKAHFIFRDEFNVEKIVLSSTTIVWTIDVHYEYKNKDKFIVSETLVVKDSDNKSSAMRSEKAFEYKNIHIYEQTFRDGKAYSAYVDETYLNVFVSNDVNIKIETILDGLIKN